MNGKKDTLLQTLACPECHLGLFHEDDELKCPSGHRFSVLRGVPRFVETDHYVRSFSFEWLTHRTTQVDRYRGDDASEQIFRLKTGLSPNDVAGKLILDAGVGVGRFSDLMAQWKANVVGVDLSYAVESAYENLKPYNNALVVQADIGRLPFRHETFDYIISIGVLHHTPDTRRYFEHLLPFLKRGGTICVWVYPASGPYLVRRHWIPFTSRIPTKMFYRWCEWFVPFAQRHKKSLLMRVVDSVFPYSDQGLGLENDILDTFDGFSPRYHGIHSPEEVEGWFRANGLTEIRQLDAPTAVRGVRAA